MSRLPPLPHLQPFRDGSCSNCCALFVCLWLCFFSVIGVDIFHFDMIFHVLVLEMLLNFFCLFLFPFLHNSVRAPLVFPPRFHTLLFYIQAAPARVRARVVARGASARGAIRASYIAVCSPGFASLLPPNLLFDFSFVLSFLLCVCVCVFLHFVKSLVCDF